MAPLLRKQTDDKAFERLYERHVKDVFRYSMAVLGERADAEDVTQTTFLNAYRAFQRGERPEKPENWLIAIAHNVCRQRFRQQQRRPAEVVFEDELGGTVEPDGDGPSVDELRRAFAALPSNQRAALVMRELEGRRYDEIAEVLGITVSALETLLFRARRSLREQLEEQLSCREAAFAISKQMDGRLSAGERKTLRAHLRACPECAQLASSQRAQRKVLRGLLAVPLPQSLQSFWPHAAETAAGGGAAAAGGTALVVKAAAVVAAGSLVGGGAYEGARQVPPLLDGPKPAAAHRAPAAPAAVRVRMAHVAPTRVAPVAVAAAPAHRSKSQAGAAGAKAHAPAGHVGTHGEVPAATHPAAHQPVGRGAAPRHVTAKPAKQPKRQKHAHPVATQKAAGRSHPTPRAARTDRQPPATSSQASQHGNGNAGGGNGNGGQHASPSAQPPESDAPTPSVTVTIPALPSVPPPLDLPGHGNGHVLSPPGKL